ncbi:recombinase family protein [Streptomyces sp. NPDC048275]|uniref:recombinase family protein n=1 Tax=Streptomyces sp. NPDC048275 TaxID=3155629 RepID=UPI0033FF41A8
MTETLNAGPRSRARAGDAEREERWKALECARPGDTIVVPSLDRLGRSIQDLIAKDLPPHEPEASDSAARAVEWWPARSRWINTHAGGGTVTTDGTEADGLHPVNDGGCVPRSCGAHPPGQLSSRRLSGSWKRHAPSELNSPCRSGPPV